MAIQTLQSTNFTIVFDPVALPKSAVCANGLFAVIEKEFALLGSWFGIADGFGPDNRVTITFVVGLPKGSANNSSYKTGGAMTINITSPEGYADALAADIGKMHFIAEFVEILMDYRSSKGPATWNSRYSHGEGLSLMCAQLRAPAGYKAWYGSFVSAWLQLPDRNAASHDWITTTNTSDSNLDSYACALLFLFYLKSQLNRSMPDIIQKGGATLEDTYKNLTGQSGAITALRNLIDPFFPIGNTPALATDNPFPLLRGAQRQVFIDASAEPIDMPYLEQSGEVVASPGLLCPKKLYRYDVFNTTQIQICVATAKGFAQPVYRWRINGVDVAHSGSITPIATVVSYDPGPSGLTSKKSEPVLILCALTDDLVSSKLDMTFGKMGNVDLVVEVFAHEKFASTDETGAITWVTVDNQTIVWEDQYYRDRDACAAKWRDFVDKHVRYDPFFNIIKTLPDPPEQYAQVIRQIEQMSLAINRLRDRAPEDARTMEKAVERATGLSASVLHEIGKLGQR